MNWPDMLLELANTGQRFVMVTVAGTRGSTPRETGAKMFVTREGLTGTIGGGQLELECTALAVQWLNSDKPPETCRRTFTLGADCGQCCGGVAEILFEQIEPSSVGWIDEVRQACEQGREAVLVTAGDSHTGMDKRVVVSGKEISGRDIAGQQALALLAQKLPPVRGTVARGKLQIPVLYEPLQSGHFEIVLFGAGHVGSAVTASLAALDCRVLWVDNRSDIFPDTLPANVSVIGADNPPALVGSMNPTAHYLVMTHSHALDLEICAAILSRKDFAYCGLIGSQSKRRRFEKRLRALGITADGIARLTCPIGIAGITGKTPAEIAVAVTAELLIEREKALAASLTPAARRRKGWR